MLIGPYETCTDFSTTGSGSAKWCLGDMGGSRFFIKQFLSPVFPFDSNSVLGKKQLRRCLCFEEQKKHLYHSVSCITGNILVPIRDFFCYENHYYAVSEAIETGNINAGNLCLHTDFSQICQVVYLVACCLKKLHDQGIVIMDLKPDHILFSKADMLNPRLIDIDSAFFISDGIDSKKCECDPVYMAPETFLYMTGTSTIPPDTHADLFSFAMVIHYLFRGTLPAFSGVYPYACVLTGEKPVFSTGNTDIDRFLETMVCPEAASRPDDSEICSFFFRFCNRVQYTPDTDFSNGLSRFMKNTR